MAKQYLIKALERHIERVKTATKPWEAHDMEAAEGLLREWRVSAITPNKAEPKEHNE